MSLSSIPVHVKCRLWGRAGGRCQYAGCNEPLWLDDVSKAQFNSAYIAHIVADQPDGPRGDPILSPKLKAELSNLMLLCDTHHRLVDIADVPGHPVARLVEMKNAHEDRIVRVGGVGANRQSEVLLYGANIGEHVRLPTFGEAGSAMLPEWYPARDRPTHLSLVNSWHSDHEEAFWTVEAENLRRGFEAELKPRLRDGSTRHLSVFAFAPQPLLVLLGYLIGDMVPAEVYQLHREPPTWDWLPASGSRAQSLEVQEPAETTGAPALVLALSATVADERVFSVLGEATSIWKVTMASPNNDYLKTREQLLEFRETLRILMDRIKARHGHGATLNVFPAAPVAACVEFGRILMPKADLPLRVYDENRRRGGFYSALAIDTGQGR